MNKVLKWVLYVLLALVILAIIAGIVFAVFGGYRYAMMRPGVRMMAPYHFYGGISPLRTIFGGLFGLGIFILVIVGIVALINAIMRGNRPVVYTQPSQPVQPATPARTCANCGKPAQEDWKTCPYCGTPLA
ncbi:MAG TPA: zinc ribbon domain-containing protein [Anaerolineales bacterium]|nr:zinc ribbon domain-containing protein [Anaerolineales bacterium]